jgi:putative transposase
MRLEYKCVSQNVHFKYVDESYTSKTCSECSYYDKNLGSSKIYICKECPNIMERDINGARNIYIKSLI